MVKHLEQAGLVTRARDTVDGRVVHVSLTASGKALKRSARRRVVEAVGCQTALTPPGIAKLRAELMALTTALRAASAEP